MKRAILVAVLFLIGSAAHAGGGLSQTRTMPTSSVALDTVVASTVACSTSTVTQVDYGSGSSAMQSRTFVRICNIDTSTIAHIGYTVTTTSSTAIAGTYGEGWAPGECKNVNVVAAIGLYCIGEQAASAPVLLVTQAR